AAAGRSHCGAGASREPRRHRGRGERRHESESGGLTMPSVGVGIIGSQFVSSIHVEALRAYPHADIRAVASPTAGHARAFAERFSIPHHLTDYKKMLAMPEIDLVVVGAP